MNHDIPDELAALPISVVKDLTSLSARQIRYYEKHGLIKPARNAANRRVYTMKDINRLKEVKKLIDKGINIAGIKAMLKS
ncbi:MerR family transcriptional regulator [Sediminibacillus halophilus]|uniref:MerR family transcriptional regulator, glutamine synthetase repressor n=1 Tax=Sediminibacillus halophilus TaxID=482461 RepID=A0A1G9NZ01_9BACI|nr:MerR family transcriptional regulator [Sediminibacillus halophilus]SDL91639.1 MerR family transcriptional regulator, glutamine synthetase repressor [Sediminibacillus halophilus]